MAPKSAVSQQPRVVRQLRRHRRLIGACLIATAAALALRSMQPPQVATTAIVVAAADLPAGHVISNEDVSLGAWPADFQSGDAFSAVSQAVGRMTTGPMITGEPLGPSRVLGPDLLRLTGDDELSTGLVAAPVRLADSGEAELVKPGDLVDVLAARATGVSGGSSESSDAQQVASGARVIVVPTAEGSSGGGFLNSSAAANDGGDTGSLVVLAVPPTTASALAAAAASSRLSVVIRAAPSVP